MKKLGVIFPGRARRDRIDRAAFRVMVAWDSLHQAILFLNSQSRGILKGKPSSGEGGLTDDTREAGSIIFLVL